MSSNVNGMKVSRESECAHASSRRGHLTLVDHPATATDDPSRIVTVTASDGKSGAEKTISYTNCKVVGNGSFGVVFAARMLGALHGPWPRGDDPERLADHRRSLVHR
jgi:hypothetical protein